MRSVRVRVLPDDFSPAMRAMGEWLVLRSNQMIQPIRLRPKRSAVSREAAVNHVFDSEH